MITLTRETSIADTLNALLAMSRMSRADLADASGYAEGQISRWLRGIVTPTPPVLLDLFNALGYGVTLTPFAPAAPDREAHPPSRTPHAHVCASCSPDGEQPGPGCLNCRHTGMDQTPCQAEGHQPECPHGCCPHIVASRNGSNPPRASASVERYPAGGCVLRDKAKCKLPRATCCDHGRAARWQHGVGGQPHE